VATNRRAASLMQCGPHNLTEPDSHLWTWYTLLMTWYSPVHYWCKWQCGSLRRLQGLVSGLASSPQEFRPAGRWALADFDGVLLSTRFEGVFRGFPVVPVERPPRSGPIFRSAGRRPFQNFRKLGPAAPKFRPVDELASPVSSATRQSKRTPSASTSGRIVTQSGMICKKRCMHTGPGMPCTRKN
jgi:hypothetical protein